MSLRENIQIQSSGAVLALQEGLYRSRQWFLNLPSWERYLIVLSVFLLIPGFFMVRYGTELVLTKQYQRESLVAQPAFGDPDPLRVSKVSIIQNANGTITAYAVATNENLDLALNSLNYTFKFFNDSGEEVETSSGETYLLPDQQRWILVPKVASSQQIVSGKVEFEEPVWQKRLSLPEVELKMSEPYVYEEINPLNTVAEGTVVNNSPFSIKQATLVLVLYGDSNEVLAVTQREEFALKPYERRAYKLAWPSIYRNDVKRIELIAYTNLLDETNLSVEGGVSQFSDPTK